MDDESVPEHPLTVQQLEDRLCTLAAGLAAAECEFLTLLAEFDAREGWAAWGIRSTAHWLSWRCGMSLGAARERVRVARALTDLPLVRDAFAAGQLSYCKVRAVTRVATPPTEGELLEIARGATGAQLERVVRAWRTTLMTELSASRHLRRGWTRREDTDGSVVYTLRVAPEAAAVIDAGVAAARAHVLDENGRAIETPEETRLADQLTDQPSAVRASADAVVLIVESFLASEDTDAKGDAYQVVIHADLDALTAPSARARGAATAADDHAARGGQPASSGDDAGESPERPTPVTGSPRDDGRSCDQRVRVARPPSCTVEGGPALAPVTVLRLLCETSARVMVHAADGRPLDLGRSARHASAKQRRALEVRDGCCRFPGCTRRRRLIPHHVHWWSGGGPTDMDNLVLLCPAHHRAVHEVGYTIAALGDGRFTFQRPDGAPVPAAPSLRAAGMSEVTTEGVDATTIQPTWGGEPLDLDLLVSGLADNALVRAGYRLLDTPNAELPGALRTAAQWPPGGRRSAAADAAA